MGKHGDEQDDLFVTYKQLRAQSHPYYQAVDKILVEKGFDRYAEDTCAKFYAKQMGRPSLAPGVYFRCLLLGYFEGIDSERRIAWRAADSLRLRDFLGIPVSKPTPDHSTISKTREVNQIPDPKPTPAGRHDCEQILGYQARPAREYRCQVSGRLAVEDPIFAPMAPSNDGVELLPKLRMKRVGDTHRTCHMLGVTCSC